MNENGESNVSEDIATALPGGRTTLSDRVKSLRLDGSNINLRPKASKLPWVLTVIFGLLAAFFGAKGAFVPPVDPSKAKGPAPAEKADSKDVALESKGYIIPAHQIQIIPKISGMVVSLNFQEGDKVKENYPLAELEDVDYKSDYDRAVATRDAAKERWEELKCNRPQEIKQAKAELEEAIANLAQLKLDWERNARLRGDTLSQKERELAQFAYEAQVARVEKLRQASSLMDEGPRAEKRRAAEAEYRQAEADLAKSKWRLDNCKISAPISGIILSKKTEKGSVVFPNSFNTAAYICDMANLKDLEVDLAIQERDIGQVFPEQKCRIVSEAYPNREPYEGWVARLMPIADRAKGAVTVRVKVKPKKGEPAGSVLKPDMGVIVAFLKEKISDGELKDARALIDSPDVEETPKDSRKEEKSAAPAEKDSKENAKPSDEKKD